MYDEGEDYADDHEWTNVHSGPGIVKNLTKKIFSKKVLTNKSKYDIIYSQKKERGNSNDS
jgi:hypothetical protein